MKLEGGGPSVFSDGILYLLLSRQDGYFVPISVFNGRLEAPWGQNLFYPHCGSQNLVYVGVLGREEGKNGARGADRQGGWRGRPCLSALLQNRRQSPNDPTTPTSRQEAMASKPPSHPEEKKMTCSGFLSASDVWLAWFPPFWIFLKGHRGILCSVSCEGWVLTQSVSLYQAGASHFIFSVWVYTTSLFVYFSACTPRERDHILIYPFKPWVPTTASNIP